MADSPAPSDPTPTGPSTGDPAPTGPPPPGPAAAAPPAAYAEGVPCWADAQLPDVEAGKRFYGELFGWTFDTGGDGGDRGQDRAGDRGEDRAGGDGGGIHLGDPYGPYVPAWRDGRPVAGLAPKRDGRMPTVWTVYFAAPDPAALIRRITAAGGQVITHPTPIDGLGTMALAADPEGAVFGLWQGGSHPGFGRRHERSAFCWAELYARDTALVDRFYGGLFHDALFGPDATPDFGRVPVSDLYPAEMPPHFLVHFGVPECETALSTVSRLGGRVLAPPFEASYGRVAVVTDSQGASFAVIER
ncbi:VOC family protein [Streptomyces sp. NPDC008313]|uniref:VOC family protein n=1 Tax=Streptomyces sp. NPDC008313 TaxID=3364826 RepID=UPI0036E292BE